MLFTFQEIFDATIMSLAVGFIFKGILGEHARHGEYDPLKDNWGGFDWRAFWFSVAIAAPAVVLHELGHKFIALLFGLQAVFHAAYTWLAIGVVLKLLNFPLLFFVPAFVSISGYFSPIVHSMIAFAGPGVNLVLWVFSWALVKFKIVRKKKHVPFLLLTARINMFLFIFNMIPLPFFDGWTVYEGIIKTLF